MLWSGPREVKPKPTAPVVTKAATASAAVLTDIEAKADESWLLGTNAQVSKKVNNYVVFEILNDRKFIISCLLS